MLTGKSVLDNPVLSPFIKGKVYRLLRQQVEKRRALLKALFISKQIKIQSVPLAIMDNTFLVTDICDKLSVCLDLLVKNGYFSECKNFREIYNKYLHPDVIDTKNPRLWEALENGEVQDVFQFNTAIGIQTVQAIHPRTPVELMAANGLELAHTFFFIINEVYNLL